MTSSSDEFCFLGHPERPHTLVIDRSIRRCATDRNKRWMRTLAAAAAEAARAYGTPRNDADDSEP
jgi:hypothetical protein